MNLAIAILFALGSTFFFIGTVLALWRELNIYLEGI